MKTGKQSGIHTGRGVKKPKLVTNGGKGSSRPQFMGYVGASKKSR